MIAIIISILISLVGSTPNMLRYRLDDGGSVDVPLACFNSKYSHYYKPGEKVRNYGLARPEFWSCSWDKFSFWTAGIIE